jgi:hypothetical protein
LALAACAQTPAATAGEDLRPIIVENVLVEVGVGSPIPVDVVVSATWPDPCAQLAQITQEIEGNTVTIDLLATAAIPDCPPDAVGVPVRIAVPLNGLALPSGEITVTVNGSSTSFAWPPAP